MLDDREHILDTSAAFWSVPTEKGGSISVRESLSVIYDAGLRSVWTSSLSSPAHPTDIHNYTGSIVAGAMDSSSPHKFQISTGSIEQLAVGSGSP